MTTDADTTVAVRGFMRAEDVRIPVTEGEVDAALVEHIIDVASTAGIRCDGVDLRPYKTCFIAELLTGGSPAPDLDWEMGRSEAEALHLLEHAVRVVARARVRMLAAKVASARIDTDQLWDAERSASKRWNADIDTLLELRKMEFSDAMHKAVMEAHARARRSQAAHQRAEAAWRAAQRRVGKLEREHRALFERVVAATDRRLEHVRRELQPEEP